MPSVIRFCLQAHADQLICTGDDLSLQSRLSAKNSCVNALSPANLGFTTDFASQRGFCICQNMTMITFSVAGFLLLLNVALISSVLSVDKLIG